MSQKEENGRAHRPGLKRASAFRQANSACVTERLRKRSKVSLRTRMSSECSLLLGMLVELKMEHFSKGSDHWIALMMKISVHDSSSSITWPHEALRKHRANNKVSELEKLAKYEPFLPGPWTPDWQRAASFWSIWRPSGGAGRQSRRMTLHWGAAVDCWQCPASDCSQGAAGQSRWRGWSWSVAAETSDRQPPPSCCSPYDDGGHLRRRRKKESKWKGIKGAYSGGCQCYILPKNFSR